MKLTELIKTLQTFQGDPEVEVAVVSDPPSHEGALPSNPHTNPLSKFVTQEGNKLLIWRLI